MEEGEKMDKDKYTRSVDRMWHNSERVRCCIICGLDDPSVLIETEMHHIDGRANSKYIIDLCKNCHTRITSEQNKFAPKDRSAKAPRNKQRGMQIINHSKLLKVLAEHDLELGREMIQNE